MDLWLIRTHQNEIAGPYTRDRLLGLIREGALAFRDEVCRANDEWFSLNELEEVRKRLGPEVPEILRTAIRARARSEGAGDDSDLTEDLTEEVLVAVDEVTEPGVEFTSQASPPSQASSQGVNPWFGEGTPSVGGQGAESTRVVGRHSPQGPGAASRPSPTVLGRSESGPGARTPPRVEVASSNLPESSLFRALGLTLALLALVTIYWVFRILRSE